MLAIAHKTANNASPESSLRDRPGVNGVISCAASPNRCGPSDHVGCATRRRSRRGPAKTCSAGIPPRLWV